MYVIAQVRGFHPETFWQHPPILAGCEEDLKAKAFKALAEDFPSTKAALAALRTCFPVEIRSAWRLGVVSLATLARQEARHPGRCAVTPACAVDTSLATPGSVTEVMLRIRQTEIIGLEQERQDDLQAVG